MFDDAWPADGESSPDRLPPGPGPEGAGGRPEQGSGPARPWPGPAHAEVVPSGWLAMEMDHATADAAALSDAEAVDAVVDAGAESTVGADPDRRDGGSGDAQPAGPTPTDDDVPF